MAREFKNIAFSEWKLKEEGEERIIEGYGATFGNTDLGNDVILKGAFKGAKQPVRMLFNHYYNQPIGKWLEFYEDSKGLYMKGKLSKTTLGNDTYELLKDGAVDSLSIGYGVKKFEWDNDKNIRYLKELDLYEVSVVVFPMNPKAKISNVKGFESIIPDNIREFEELLKNFGFSNEEAKITASKSFQPLVSLREEGDFKTELREEELKKLLSTTTEILKCL